MSLSPMHTDPRSATEYPELAGRVAVVTGAAQGMGACFASGLARQGVNVFSVDVISEALNQTVQTSQSDNSDIERRPGSISAFPADVSSRTDMHRVAEHVIKRCGRLDIWVNNAGIFPQSEIAAVSQEQLDKTFGVNVDGVFFGTQAAAAQMAHGGAIVNMASVAAVRVRKLRAVYSASKAAVQHLTSSLAVELGGAGIRVNALAPG